MSQYNPYDEFCIPDEIYEMNCEKGEQDRIIRLRELVDVIEEMNIPDAMIESAIACLEELLDDACN